MNLWLITLTGWEIIFAVACLLWTGYMVKKVKEWDRKDGR